MVRFYGVRVMVVFAPAITLEFIGQPTSNYRVAILRMVVMETTCRFNNTDPILMWKLVKAESS